MRTRTHLIAAVIAATAALPLAAAAQQAGGTTAGQRGLLPGTTEGYVGANLGRPDFNVPCTAGFACSDPSLGWKIYAGGKWNEVVGVELGYIDFGKAERSGGNARARGVALSALGNWPVTQQVDLFARLGGTYARTRTSAATVIDPVVPTGNRNTFGLNLGVGVSFDVAPNVAIVGEWERHRLRFVTGRDNVDMLSVGARWQF